MTNNPPGNIFLPPSQVIPQFLVITSITKANQAVVTVSTANFFVIGQLVKFSVPSSYGMYEIDQMKAEIISIDATNLIFTVSINTTQFNAFVTPSTFQEQPATMSPSGSRNIYNVTTVPFRSLANIGN